MQTLTLFRKKFIVYLAMIVLGVMMFLSISDLEHSLDISGLFPYEYQLFVGFAALLIVFVAWMEYFRGKRVGILDDQPRPFTRTHKLILGILVTLGGATCLFRLWHAGLLTTLLKSERYPTNTYFSLIFFGIALAGVCVAYLDYLFITGGVSHRWKKIFITCVILTGVVVFTILSIRNYSF